MLPTEEHMLRFYGVQSIKVLKKHLSLSVTLTGQVKSQVKYQNKVESKVKVSFTFSLN